MILRGHVFSNTLEMDTGITVVAPNNFNYHNYKVVYLLHGLCSNNSSWADYTMLPVFANNYDSIFILPEVGRSFYTDMKYGVRYFSFITEELPKICKNIFNISAKKEDTAIMGASMGGYGALKSALSKPDQYGFCGAFASGCLFLKEGLDFQRNPMNNEKLEETFGKQLLADFRAIFGDNLEWCPDFEILELAKKVADNKPRLYINCGTHDPFYKDNVRFIDEMKKIPYDLDFEELEGCGHDWLFF